MRARNTPYPIEFRQQMVELVEAGRKPVELVKEHKVQWHIAMHPSQRKQLGQRHNPVDAITGEFNVSYP